MKSKKLKPILNSAGRRLCACALAMSMVFSLAACGRQETTDEPKKEWAYVPEFVTIDNERIDYYNMQAMGDNLYSISWDWDEDTGMSTQSICKYSLTDQSLTVTPVVWPEGTVNMNINEASFMEDGSLYATVYNYSEDGASKYFICKFDPEGNWIFSREITDLVADTYINAITVDGEGRIYMAGDNTVWLLDAEGNQKGTISLDAAQNTWINRVLCGKDKKVYVTYRNYGDNGSEYVLCTVDFENKKLGDACTGLPSNSNNVVPGTEYDFLVHDGVSVYGYNLDKQESEYLFDWLDSDINGNSVGGFGALEDGRIVAVVQDWENNDNGVALLTKKKAEEVPEKETIVVGTISGMYNLQSQAVKFNKENPQYHISVKQYYDYNGGESAWSDALTKLNNDITSGSCPDIIDLSVLNVEQLAAKDVFEDLSAYLDKSSVLSRSDFIENILDIYTFNDVLVSIPSMFVMQTIIGSAGMVGDESGWTLEELIALADAHPEAEIFDKMSKQSIMYILMIFNENAFIDWSTGECSFDSDEFKQLLEFVNRFPDEVDYSDSASTPTRIQKGEVLLDEAYIYDFDQMQMYVEMFGGKATCIGFPTMDGKGGHALSANNAYAISSKSSHKDGAWAFIESILAQEENGRYWNGFPTVKSKLDAMIEDATKVEYVTDENGDPLLDEEGEPIISGGYSSVGYEDGWEYIFRTPTQEEVDIVLALMEEAKPVSYGGDDEIMNIINEEAEAYYTGQKSVDEVAGIIQSRVNIYVSENR